MKRTDLIKAIKSFGCVLVRHGGKHDWYQNPVSGISQAVPRHREINERLARSIIKVLSNPEGSGEDADSAQ